MRGPCLLSLSAVERGVAWQGILELPRLEEEVLGHALGSASPEEAFRSGVEEWWAGFISTECL